MRRQPCARTAGLPTTTLQAQPLTFSFEGRLHEQITVLSCIAPACKLDPDPEVDPDADSDPDPDSRLEISHVPGSRP